MNSSGSSGLEHRVFVTEFPGPVCRCEASQTHKCQSRVSTASGAVTVTEPVGDGGWAVNTDQVEKDMVAKIQQLKSTYTAHYEKHKT